MAFKKYSSIILVNVIVFLFFCVILEAFLRMINLGYGSAPLLDDPVYHHVYTKNYSFTVHDPEGEYGGHIAYYGNNGFRVNDKKIGYAKGNKGKVNSLCAVIGDSFVVGAQVPWEETFIGRLNDYQNEVEYLNYGSTSYAPSLYYLILKNKVLTSTPMPDKVIVLLYSNDLGDDEKYLSEAVFDENNELVGINGGKPDRFISLLRKSYLIRLVRKTQLTFQYLLFSNKKTLTVKIGKYLESSPKITGSRSEPYLLKMKDLCRQKGVSFYLTAVPSKYKCLTNDRAYVSFGDRVKSWSALHNINFIDLESNFLAKTEEEKEELFFDLDIHFTSKGHQVTAEILGEYFDKNHMIVHAN
ncbi:MAG: hypothetical protein RIC15_06775 [Vicingaceae bacterium]